MPKMTSCTLNGKAIDIHDAGKQQVFLRDSGFVQPHIRAGQARSGLSLSLTIGMVKLVWCIPRTTSVLPKRIPPLEILQFFPILTSYQYIY